VCKQIDFWVIALRSSVLFFVFLLFRKRICVQKRLRELGESLSVFYPDGVIAPRDDLILFL